LLVAGAVALPALNATPVQAQVVLDEATHRRFGVERAIGGSSTSMIRPLTAASSLQGAGCNTNCTALTYHSGPVQHGEKDYLFFWTPSGHEAPGTYVSGLQTWLNQVAAADYSAGNPFAVTQQYYDFSGTGGAKSFVPYAVENAGTVVDADSYPASGCTDKTAGGASVSICLTDEQIRSELESYVKAHSLPTGINVEYFVMTPENVGSCFEEASKSCSYTSYCGYHSYAGSGSTQIVYADMPWAYKVSGCDVNEAFGAGYANSDYIDSVVSVFSHELSETMTDPNLNAWWETSYGNEIGDKCAYRYSEEGYGSMKGLSKDGGGYWNVAFESNFYLLQTEFDNHTSNCTMEATSTQPVVSVSTSPSPVVPGSQATLTAKVTDPAGVSSVQWSFGDGESATGNPVNHTYATGGTKTLTAIVTDNAGNEKRVTQSVEPGDESPAASFAVTSASPTAGQPVTFDGSASSDSDGSITGYSWNFGDGTQQSGGATIAHTYATAGVYTATLTVTDSSGLSGEIAHQVTVAGISSGGGETTGAGGAETTGGAGKSTTGTAISAGTSATPATTTVGKRATTASTRAHCHLVIRRVRGHKRKVEVCTKRKPKSKRKRR
jgi:PKD repeat protein